MQEFHVGLPCLKLSRNPSNQRHHGKAARTCSVKDAWDEMSDKRKGRDKTIDHDLTKDNVWLCGNTDMDMEQVIQAEIDRINAERAEQGKRKMRIDAVSAIEMIQKPPMEVMETLTREEQTKLLKVSDEVTESILHDWNPSWKTIATVIHFDEFGGRSGHPHKIFIPIGEDKDGCPVLNAKRDFNLKFFTFINREYPQRMRERGYPVLDCEIYEDMTEEEREAHKEKKKEYGLEGYEYKLKKDAEQEAQIKANEQLIEGQTDILDTQKKLIAVNDETIADQDGKIVQGEQELDNIRADVKTAEKTLDEVNADITNARETLKTVKDDVTTAKAEVTKQKAESKDLRIKILAKEKVLDLPEPPKTLDRQFYKVPIAEYKSVRATAAQVDVLKEEYEERKKAQDKRDRALDKRKADLDQEKKDFEKSRKLPFAEQTELLLLRHFKKTISWLREQSFVPEVIRRLLTRALRGEDLEQTLSRVQPERKQEKQYQASL